jgi:catechol 2,3-dioxygenase-like lactoylglutathione lyase family enzyme
MTELRNVTVPPIEAVIETAIYAADLGAAETFYAGVLGLPVIGRESGPHVFFRVGEASVLLVFNPDATLAGGMLPPHGTRGPGHFALGVPVASLDVWRDHLTACGVAIEKEVT